MDSLERFSSKTSPSLARSSAKPEQARLQPFAFSQMLARKSNHSTSAAQARPEPAESHPHRISLAPIEKKLWTRRRLRRETLHRSRQNSAKRERTNLQRTRQSTKHPPSQVGFPNRLPAASAIGPAPPARLLQNLEIDRNDSTDVPNLWGLLKRPSQNHATPNENQADCTDVASIHSNTSSTASNTTTDKTSHITTDTISNSTADTTSHITTKSSSQASSSVDPVIPQAETPDQPSPSGNASSAKDSPPAKAATDVTPVETTAESSGQVTNVSDTQSRTDGQGSPPIQRQQTGLPSVATSSACYGYPCQRQRKEARSECRQQPTPAATQTLSTIDLGHSAVSRFRYASPAEENPSPSNHFPDNRIQATDCFQSSQSN